MKKRVITHFNNNWQTWVLLILIITLAGALRFTGIDWDQGAHLHPDERFLSMVTNDIKWPGNVTSYFDTATSPLNPANAGKPFFVYGTFPVFLTKLGSDLAGYGEYGGYTLVGRIISAIFDILIIVFVFLIAREIFDKRVALLSSLFLAFTVIHIQHSHFYVTDLFATFFIVLSFYFLILWTKTNKKLFALLLGISWGLALASKMNAVLFSIIIFVGAIVLLIKQIKYKLKQRIPGLRAFLTTSSSVFLVGLLIVASAFIIFRILQPYAFSGPHMWTVTFSDTFVSSFKELARLSNKVSASGFVPAFQWIGRPWYFHMQTLTLWGIGIPLSIFCWLGLILATYLLIFKKQSKLLFLVAWPLFIIIYQSFQFPKTLRYLLPATPFLIILGAFFLITAYDYLKKTRTARKLFLLRTLFTLVIISCLLWGAAYESIYLHQQTRLAASAWIYDNIPVNTTVTVEPWDDGIPIHLRNRDPPPDLNHVSLDFFGTTTDQKLQTLSEQLSNASYIFITSGRNYKVLPRLNKYPYITTYYELLFAEKLGYTLEQKFTNYPSLGEIQFSDEDAEESFVVYDHPTVLIYKNQQKLNSTQIFDLIKGEQHNSNETDVVAK